MTVRFLPGDSLPAATRQFAEKTFVQGGTGRVNRSNVACWTDELQRFVPVRACYRLLAAAGQPKVLRLLRGPLAMPLRRFWHSAGFALCRGPRRADRICWSALLFVGPLQQMTPQPSIFLSHNYRDKPFVRTLAQDLTAMGVKVWVDEAELRVGDSLITRISLAIDEMRYLGVVLSPHSVDSRWVREELNQALTNQLAQRATSVLPILLADCQIPGFLRDRLYADFRDPGNYADALQRLLQSIGIDNPGQRAPSSIRLRGALPESATSTCVPKRGTALHAVRDPAGKATTICAWNAGLFVRSLVVQRRSSSALNAAREA